MGIVREKFDELASCTSLPEWGAAPFFSKQNIFMQIRGEMNLHEWISFLLLCIGIDFEKVEESQTSVKYDSLLEDRMALNLIARFLPFVVNNFNFIELGPRGTGKSFLYSLFKNNSCPLSSGRISSSELFYNYANKKVGIIGSHDNIVFDELQSLKIGDPTTINVMKDYMAHGGFSIGQSEITANSSFSFLWTIDINKELKQRKGNLFALLPNIFDTAFFDRIHFFLPGWEIPRITNSYLIKTNPVIINHLSHFFHVLFNIGEPFMDLIEKRFKLENSSITNRDNIAIRKNLLGLLKLVFPIGEPNPDEFDQLIHYSIECRRRISEQMVLQEPEIFNLGDYAYLNRNGERIKVFCPESNF